MATTPFFPRTPKFLFIRLGNREEAIKSIKFYHGDNADHEVVLSEYHAEGEFNSATQTHATIAEVLEWKHCFPLHICLVR